MPAWRIALLAMVTTWTSCAPAGRRTGWSGIDAPTCADELVDAVDAIDLEQPLNLDCTLDDARAALPGLAQDATAATLGIGYPRTVRVVHGAKAGAVVKLWFELDLVAMIEIDEPHLPKPWRKLLFELDPPETHVDLQLGYPSQGFAVAVSEDEQVAEKILLFRPTSPAHFAEYYALPAE